MSDGTSQATPYPEPQGRWRRPRDGWFGIKHAYLSSDYSRDKGIITLLAIVETLLAVIAYWAIALLYNTHVHLIASLCIAPLLLLRSPSSIEKGVNWFVKDHFKISDWSNFSRRRKALWIALYASLGGAAAFLISSHLSHHWLADYSGFALFWRAATVGGIAVAVAVAVAGAGAVAGAVVVALAVAEAVEGAVAVTGAAAVGILIRALFCRVVATLRHLLKGLQQLPNNWFENNLYIDSLTDTELLPGIKKADDPFSLSCWLDEIERENSVIMRTISTTIALIFFLPAFLYRFSIKSTAWFYWPLFYLLRPLPVVEVDRKAWLTEPAGNRVLMLLFSIAGVAALWQLFTIFGADVNIPEQRYPWLAHFNLLNELQTHSPLRWLVVVAGAASVLRIPLATHLRHYYDKAGNFQPPPWKVRAMKWLFRLQRLAVIFLLLAGVVTFALLTHPELLSFLPNSQVEWVSQFLGVIVTDEVS